MSSPAEAASGSRSFESDVNKRSPSDARRTRAASITSFFRDFPRRMPARRPKTAAGGTPHLFRRDLAKLALVIFDKSRQGLQPAIMLELKAKRVIHPGADAAGMATRHGVLHRFDQVGIYRRRQTLLVGHTFILTQ